MRDKQAGTRRVHRRPIKLVEAVKKRLGLKPLPVEGGYFAESYRSKDVLGAGAIDRGPRALSTAIYYLLTPDTCSRLHRLASDEIYHFYLGDPVELLQLLPDGTGRTIILGADMGRGMVVQAVVPRGVWQGSRLRRGGKFALMGTTMAPGFDPADCQFGDRALLTRTYRQWRAQIARLTAE